MKTYSIDYYLLDKEGNRESDFYDTAQVEAKNDDDATIKSALLKYFDEHDIGLWDFEISSIYQEED